MDSSSFTQILGQAMMVLIPMILSLTVHECAHAFTAKRLGDDTAERAGRMTLNPLPHIDPMGTIMLPLLILVARGASGSAFVPFFGWAKPTPVNESRFRRTIGVRAGSMAVAAAGPVSNLMMAWLCAAALSAMFHFGQTQGAMAALVQLMNHMIFINLGLCVFNLIPVAPLDGQKVVSGLLPVATAMRFENFNARYGTFILLAIVFFARDYLTYPVQLLLVGVMRTVGLG